MKKAEKAINVIFALGAAIVIMGAWQKITHRPGADLFLTIGLLTEVVIFVISAAHELFKKSDIAPQINIPQGHVGDAWELTEAVNNLNRTIKKVFNQ